MSADLREQSAVAGGAGAPGGAGVPGGGGAGGRPPAGGGSSLGRGALLVAEREVMAQVRSKAFVVSTALLLVGILAAIVVGQMLAGRTGGDVRVAVVPQVAAQLAGAEGIETVDVADEAAARAAVTSGDVTAAVLTDSGAAGVRVIVQDSAPGALMTALTVAPDVEVLNPASADEGVRYLITFGFGLVFMASALSFGSTIAQSTVTEKQTRVVELLLAAVPARALLAGKVLGNSVLALGQTAAIAAVAVIGLVVTGQDDVLALVGAPMVWFVVFFAVGFVLLAAMFAAAASLVSRMEDTGPVLTPVMYLVMIPYFLVVFFNDNEVVLRVMSYVPFSAPVGMPVRLFLGDAAWWEPLVALVVLAAAAAGVIAVAARIYERSVLRTGARVRLSQVLGRERVTS